jgi:hypothetical protein
MRFSPGARVALDPGPAPVMLPLRPPRRPKPPPKFCTLSPPGCGRLCLPPALPGSLPASAAARRPARPARCPSAAYAYGCLLLALPLPRPLGACRGGPLAGCELSCPLLLLPSWP